MILKENRDRIVSWRLPISLIAAGALALGVYSCLGDKNSPKNTPDVVPFGTDAIMVADPTFTPTPACEAIISSILGCATSTPGTESTSAPKTVESCIDWCGDSNKVGTGDQVGDIKFNCIEAIQKIEVNPTTKTKIITKLSFYGASSSTSNKLDRHELAKTIFQLDENGNPKCYVLKWSSANGSGSNCPNAEGITLPECP